jgi:hypothetical protein
MAEGFLLSISTAAAVSTGLFGLLLSFWFFFFLREI